MFEAGDVVQLKSGGPGMTVWVDPLMAIMSGPHTNVVWTDFNGHYHKALIPTAALKKVM